MVLYLSVLALAVLVVGCGDGGLSASSTCTDFSKASPEEQFKAISTLSTEFRTPELTTPLGEPEVGYACAAEPEMTLEEFFSRAHRSEAGINGAEDETSDSESDGSEEVRIEDDGAVEELLADVPQQELTLGQPDAPVRLIEFADLQSPVCKSYAEDQLSQLIAGPIADGRAQIVYSNFMIIGPQSTAAAAAALAAGKQDRGWNFIELFYRNQGIENSGFVTDEYLTALAEAVGVEDIPRWDEERDSPELRHEVEETTSEAEKLGVNGTPYFGIEGPATKGLELLGTPSSASELEEDIESAS